MKNSELIGLSMNELKNKLVTEKENYSKLKFAHSITPIENPLKIRETRRFVARIMTEIRKRELSK